MLTRSRTKGKTGTRWKRRGRKRGDVNANRHRSPYLRASTIIDSPRSLRKVQATDNVFCATGEGGGVDPTCSPGGSSGGKTNTPEFKKWFGDSKVVDEAGKPLVMYHGTDKNFDVFDDEGSRVKGFWFTADKETAEYYGSLGESGHQAAGMPGAHYEGTESGRVVEAHLSIKNPARETEYRAAEKQAVGEGLDGFASESRAVDILKAKGFDGATYQDMTGTTWIAFHPHQIKSAVGNRGTFDPEDPITTHARVGARGKPRMGIEFPPRLQINASRPRPNPLRVDPTRTSGVRRRFSADIKRRLAAIKAAIRRFLVTDDELGLVENVFCPTGEGGGVDPSCSPGGAKEYGPVTGDVFGRSLMKDANLDVEEIAAVSSYKESGYRRINSYLRGRNEGDDRTFRQVAALDRAFTKVAPLDRDVVAWRGGEVDGKTYVSASLVKGGATHEHTNRVRLVIPKGTKVLYLDAVLPKDELEVLLPRGWTPTANTYCPTGEGGGVDPSCSSESHVEIERWAKSISKNPVQAKERLRSYVASRSLGRRFGQSTEEHWAEQGLTAFGEWASKQLATNAFCPTGPGGGVDPTCGSEGMKSEKTEFGEVWRSDKGFVQVRVETTGDVPSVERIFVKEEFRKQGVAKKMLLALAKHYGRITSSEGGNTNEAAARVWRSLGATVGSNGVDFELTANAFCPTGPGGGQDNSCPPGNKALTESVAFKKWFGDSKVLDDSGSPLVVYHGTGRDFYKFDIDKAGANDRGYFGKGIYFSGNPGVASDYSLLRGAQSHVKPSYLKLENPFRFDYSSYKSATDTRKTLRSLGVDLNLAGFPSDVDKFKSVLQDKGYDGVVAFRQDGDTVHDAEYVAFHPRQIKSSVTGNATINAQTFRFSSSPEKLAAFRKWLAAQMKLQGLLFTEHKTEERQWWERYIREVWQQGQARAYDEVNRSKKVKSEMRDYYKDYAEREPGGKYRTAKGGYKTEKSTDDFYVYGKEQFLRDSFQRPISVERVQQMASRTFTDLKGFSDDMATRINRTLTDGLIKGQSPRETAKEIADQLDISESRALTIARTETIRALNEGALDAMERSGVERVGVAVEWSVSGLGETALGNPSPCPVCEPLKGVVFKIAEAHGLIPRHPNCLCSFIPANVGEDGEDQIDTQSGIERAIRESLEEEGGKEKSSWGGAESEIDEERPKSIFNVYDPDQERDEQGRWSSSGGANFEKYSDAFEGQYGSDPKDDPTREAFRRYLHGGASGFKSMNAELRAGGMPKEVDLLMAVAKPFSKINESLDNDGVVYRGVTNLKALGLDKGDSFVELGLMSTSTDPVEAGNFATQRGGRIKNAVMRIKPDGDVLAFVGAPGQREVVLEPGTRLTVTGRRVGKFEGDYAKRDVVILEATASKARTDNVDSLAAFSEALAAINAYCPTGEGGGVDPTCSPVGSSAAVDRMVNDDGEIRLIDVLAGVDPGWRRTLKPGEMMKAKRSKELRDVAIESLIATQASGSVDPSIVKEKLKTLSHQEPGALLVGENAGKMYLIDGHHSAVALLVEGKKSAMMRYHNFDN